MLQSKKEVHELHELTRISKNLYFLFINDFIDKSHIMCHPKSRQAGLIMTIRQNGIFQQAHK